MMKTFKNQKGITLVALVITLVVLIILATVAINLSLGGNGIFNRAKTAKEQYQNAQNYEEAEIAKASNQISEYVDGNRGTVTISEEEYTRLLNSSNANNYSTTQEKPIGTWIDGKTIYQKTFDLGENKTISYDSTFGAWGGKWLNTEIPGTNINTIISCTCIDDNGGLCTQIIVVNNTGRTRKCWY